MALPGHRRTSSDKRRRAAHFALKKAVVASCAKCQSPVRPHHACATCGTYNGREAVNTSRDAERLLKKTQTKAQAAVEAEAPKADAKAESKEKKPAAKKASKDASEK